MTYVKHVFQIRCKYQLCHCYQSPLCYSLNLCLAAFLLQIDDASSQCVAECICLSIYLYHNAKVLQIFIVLSYATLLSLLLAAVGALKSWFGMNCSFDVMVQYIKKNAENEMSFLKK